MTAKEIAIYALLTIGAIGWCGAIVMAVVHYVWTQKRMREIRKRERIWK